VVEIEGVGHLRNTCWDCARENFCMAREEVEVWNSWFGRKPRGNWTTQVVLENVS